MAEARLYRIKDWSDHFENNRSKAITTLRWVPIPNRHDGETFSLIMRHKDGAIIFAAWVLLLQLASKCDPRGTLLRGNGQPHNVSSMSAKCRCPDVWFETALDYLEHHTDWIEVEPFTEERQVNVSPTSGERQEGALKEGRNRRNGSEGTQRDVELPNGFPKTVEEAKAHAGFVGVTEDFAATRWNTAMGRGGRDSRGQEIRSFRHYLASAAAYAKSDGTFQSPAKSEAQGYQCEFGKKLLYTLDREPVLEDFNGDENFFNIADGRYRQWISLHT